MSKPNVIDPNIDRRLRRLENDNEMEYTRRWDRLRRWNAVKDVSWNVFLIAVGLSIMFLAIVKAVEMMG